MTFLLSVQFHSQCMHLMNIDREAPVKRSRFSWSRPIDIAKRSALSETHGPGWPLPCKLRHGWELRQR